MFTVLSPYTVHPPICQQNPICQHLFWEWTCDKSDALYNFLLFIYFDLLDSEVTNVIFLFEKSFLLIKFQVHVRSKVSHIWQNFVISFYKLFSETGNRSIFSVMTGSSRLLRFPSRSIPSISSIQTQFRFFLNTIRCTKIT